VAPLRSTLAAIAWCESRGNYRTNTGNGFFGAYQFLPSTWRAVGGRGMPHLASPAEQDYRAALLYVAQGPGPWPRCGYV
jgi:muramidase (phage lysozyme)